MFFNYLKTGIRNLLRYKIFSFINVFGLAAALSVGMLIILMMADQKSHDQFNVKKDRIYRILCDRPDYRHPYATSPYPLANMLRKDYPIIETSTALLMGVGGDAQYEEQNVTMVGYFADTAFFNVFSYELEQGDRNTALTEPHSMVITHAMARQLFRDEEPLGKTVAFSDRGLTVFGGISPSWSSSSRVLGCWGWRPIPRSAREKRWASAKCWEPAIGPIPCYCPVSSSRSCLSPSALPRR